MVWQNIAHVRVVPLAEPYHEQMLAAALASLSSPTLEFDLPLT